MVQLEQTLIDEGNVVYVYTNNAMLDCDVWKNFFNRQVSVKDIDFIIQIKKTEKKFIRQVLRVAYSFDKDNWIDISDKTHTHTKS